MKRGGDEKLTSRWFWSKSQQRHSERIKEIKISYSKRIDNSAPKSRTCRRSSSKFIADERKSVIRKDNLTLLSMLVDISKGSRASSTHSIIDSVRDLPMGKSLNRGHRMEEAKRINSDNEKLARRIMKSTQGVSFKKLDQDWVNSMKYKKTISKAKFRALPKLSEKNRNSEKSEEKSRVQKRTQSLCDATQTSFFNRDGQLSPMAPSVNSEIVFIDQHLPSATFLVKGVNQRIRRLDPIAINPPKPSVRLPKK